jgi:hypothetical protein
MTSLGGRLFRLKIICDKVYFRIADRWWWNNAIPGCHLLPLAIGHQRLIILHNYQKKLLPFQMETCFMQAKQERRHLGTLVNIINKAKTSWLSFS